MVINIITMEMDPAEMFDQSNDPSMSNQLMNEEQEENDDDDPVVDEWDVVLSDGKPNQPTIVEGPFGSSEPDANVASGSDRKILLFQYNMNESPLFSDARINSIKVKPSFSLFQMDVAMNMEKSHFDLSRSESLADKIDGSKMRSDKVHFPGGRMERFVLTSKPVKPAVSKFMVGKVKKKRKQVVLVPVDTSLELRSNVSWLDKTDIKIKGKGATKQQEEEGEEEEEESAPSTSAKKNEARVVTVRFAGPEEEKIRAARERSYIHYQNRVEQEPWRDVRINTSNSNVAKDERYHMFSGLMNASTSATSTSVTPAQYDSIKAYLDHLKSTS